ncbi:MAG: hypothetical protein AB1744_10260 [Candidatus Zixiibacteriota bacterium]
MNETSDHLFPVFGAGLRRVARLIRLVGFSALLTSCAVPGSYGPYYRPTYQGIGHEARIAPPGKSPAPPSRLWIEPGDRGCRFILWADADERNLVLSWSVWQLRKWARCIVSDAPLLIQDLDTGRQINIQRLRMIEAPTSLSAPRLDIRQEVDLASLIPGFRAAPPSERRYTVSLGLRRAFDGPLPERVTIQLPELVVGGRRLRPPPLTLARGEQFARDDHEYVPVSHTRLLPSVALAEFAGRAGAGRSGGGSFRMAFAGTYGWHDEPNALRLATTFSGYPYGWLKDGMKKDTTKSTVSGYIHVEVLSGERLCLAADTVTWQAAGDGAPVAVPVSDHWTLSMYTPARHGDSFERFLDWKNRPWGTTADLIDRQLLALIPNFRPKRFRVTLPPVITHAGEQSLGPIEFEYQPGGVGLAVWP